MCEGKCQIIVNTIKNEAKCQSSDFKKVERATG